VRLTCRPSDYARTRRIRIGRNGSPQLHLIGTVDALFTRIFAILHVPLGPDAFRVIRGSHGTATPGLHN
jgi:hypothetical protein